MTIRLADTRPYSVDDSHSQNVLSTTCQTSNESEFWTIPAHPLGILPSGNAYLSEKNLKRALGSFSVLPDEVLVLLLEYLEAPDLTGLSSTCKAFFAFCRLEDLWKNLLIE